MKYCKIKKLLYNIFISKYEEGKILYKVKYQAWLDSAIINEEIKNELRNIKDEKEIEERFYKDYTILKHIHSI